MSERAQKRPDYPRPLEEYLELRGLITIVPIYAEDTDELIIDTFVSALKNFLGAYEDE